MTRAAFRRRLRGVKTAGLSLPPPDTVLPRPVTSPPADLGRTPGWPDQPTPLSQTEWEEPIYIPESARNLSLRNFSLSVAARYFLSCHEFWRAGDFTGWSLLGLRSLPWCDLATLAEVRQLVHAIQQTDPQSPAKILALRQARELAARAQPTRPRCRKNWRLADAIFVPEPLRARPLQELALSVRLTKVLGQMHLACLGDLHGRTFHEFLMLRNCGYQTLRELLRRLRQFADEHHCELRPPALFNVPESVRNLRFCDLPISVRLANLLADMQLHCLGDLHGRPHEELLRKRFFGKRTLAELKRLVEQAAVGDGLLLPPFSPLRRPFLCSVPESIRSLPFRDLPLSARLAKVLANLNLHCFGDFHDRPYRDLLLVANCGKKTLAELERLIVCATAGDFTPPAEAPADLARERVRTLDDLLATRPERDREILCCRLTASADAPPTLKKVGQKFGVTRERVRQIVRSELKKLRQQGSLRLRWLLAQPAGCPPAAGLRYPPEFYLRLAAALQDSWAESPEA